MHFTLKKTLKLVLDSGNDYVVAVKRNQQKLYEHLQTFEQYLRPVAEHTHHTCCRGREEYRRVKVYQACGFDEMKWVGVKSIVCVERWGRRQGKDYRRKVFYISSILTAPQQWQSLIRGHWGIENRLHWPKDKILGEDDYRLDT